MIFLFMSGDKKKILLVEDDKILSQALSDGLKEAVFSIAQAFDGEEGLTKAFAAKPDLILLDIMMPKMDGLTVAKKLKSDPSTRNIPTIILTMLETGEPLAEAIQTGVYEYLVKSDFEIEDIVAKVKERLGVA